MEIQTKYNLGNKVKFYPFNDTSLTKISGLIHTIDCKITGMNKTAIEYGVKDQKGTVWAVSEADIIS